VVLPERPTVLQKIAAEDIKTYFELAARAKVNVQTETGAPAAKLSGTVICLGELSAKAWKRPPSAAKALPPECFEIASGRGFPNPQTDTVWITGASDRAVFYGVVELLGRALGARWFPPRIYPGSKDTACLETQLISAKAVCWPTGTVRGGPKLKDRGVYFGSRHLRRCTVDWLLRNRINVITLSMGTQFPLSQAEQARCRQMIAYAKQRGIKVLLISISQNVSEDSKKTHPEICKNGAIDPTLPVTKTESVKLFVDLVKRYDLDGFAWHSATEGIRIAKTPRLAAKPRYIWEAEYHKAYRQAIGEFKPDARFVMLMGWVYMNPAATMAKHFPKDTVAWVVPNTPIIDAANTDLDAYSKHFHCWYWLYVNVSKDAEFPVVKTDYLEKYCREAVERGHGLMPQSAFYANTFNLQYVADAAWSGPAKSAAYMDQYCADYFAGIPAAGEAVEAYTRVTTRWRNWTNNIQTRPIAIRSEDFAQLKIAYEKFTEAYQAAPTPLVADRIRDFAVSTLRAFKRFPGRDPRRHLAACRHAQKVFGKRPYDSGEDFFGQIVRTEEADAAKAAASLKQLPGIRLKWEFQPPGHGYLCGHVLVADGDGDGKNEVFCGSYTPRAYCLSGEDGSVLWSYKVETGTVGCDCTTLADVDGDGKLELIFGTEPSPTVYVLRTARDAEPRLVWRHRLVGAFVAGGAAAFQDTDGAAKIIAATRWASPQAQGHLYFFNARDGSQYRQPTDQQDVCSCTPAVADLNGDGALDFVYGNHKLRGIEQGGKVICRRVKDGEILWTYDMGDNTGSSTPTICDLDGDGKPEVIATCCHSSELVKPPRWTTVALRGTDGSLIWEHPFRAGAGVAVGKLKGRLHVYGVSTQGDHPYVTCVRGADGKQVWRLKIDAAGGAQPLVADCDGDGRDELLYGDSANRLVIRRAASGELLHTQWLGEPTKPRHRNIGLAAVTLADADNDGSWEILVPSGDGYYRCLDTDWKVPPGADTQHRTKSLNLLRTGNRAAVGAETAY